MVKDPNECVCVCVQIQSKGIDFTSRIMEGCVCLGDKKSSHGGFKVEKMEDGRTYYQSVQAIQDYPERVGHVMKAPLLMCCQQAT